MCLFTPRATSLIALPGTGFDASYSRLAFGALAERSGCELVVVDPVPGALLAHYTQECADAIEQGTAIIVGVSIGAIAAVRHALAIGGGESSGNYRHHVSLDGR